MLAVIFPLKRRLNTPACAVAADPANKRGPFWHGFDGHYGGQFAGFFFGKSRRQAPAAPPPPPSSGSFSWVGVGFPTDVCLRAQPWRRPVADVLLDGLGVLSG